MIVLNIADGATVDRWDTPQAANSGGDRMPHWIAVSEFGTVLVGESKLNRLVKYRAV